MVYYRLEPWGPERADLNAGIIASTLANCHRDAKRRSEPFSPSEFMPKFGEIEQKAEPDGMDPFRVASVMRGLMLEQRKHGVISPQRTEPGR